VIARVIINHNAKEVDKLYDYVIPEEFEGKIGVGSRVTVPFGRGDKHREGFVFKISENSKVGKLKAIFSLEEGGKVFDEKMLQLINWMREKYLCTYIDILRAIVPAGISNTPTEWILLEKKADDLTTIKSRIVEILEDNGGAAEMNFLQSFFEKNIRTHVLKLCEKGILRIEYKENQKVHDKKIRVAALAIDDEDVSDIAEELKMRRAYAQAKILEILVGNEFISLADLVLFAETGYNTLQTLEKKGYISISEITVTRDPFYSDDIKPDTPHILNEQQSLAFRTVKEKIEDEKQQTFLLHGVTGSGKTEVFMNVISEVIKKGKKAVLLVPEISLTPQMVQRFIARFGKRVAVFHSGLSLGEKYDQWKRMRDNDADIVIGARSAVFAPFDNIGVIIMDEEHEQTYKSESSPRYQTVEVAEFRAKQHNAVLLLASATPSVVSYYKAGIGEYRLLTLDKRANAGNLPEVSVVDMRSELEDGNKSIFSKKLAEAIKLNLDKKEQTILFLNRRGFSSFVSCRSCGYVPKCPECSISLTYHKFNDQLKCHYCGYTRKNPVVCPVCESKYIRYFGGGTQKVEEEVKNMFPDATTIRMDVDTTGAKFAHEKILDEFENKHIDILIGTQMVAKGLDFEDVTLVGVVSADVMLNLDDYRSGERSFSILEQVNGRAGRAKKEGRAIVQTYSPEHAAIEYMQKHSYIDFYNSEIAMRKAMWYPPFCEMVLIMFSGTSENLVPQAARYFAKCLVELKDIQQKTKVLGPIQAPIAKIKNKHRWQMVIKCENSDGISEILEQARLYCRKNQLYRDINIVIDKNPNGIM